MGKNLFNSIKLMKPKKNVFDLSHDVKLSTDMGKLTPIMQLECVPGDKISISCESLIRFAPLIAPIMHRVDVTMHYFFVPNRILWSNWEKFITDANTEHVLPYITYDGITDQYSKFLDYMGVPPGNGGENVVNINALPLAAYQCIYNEYYRDQNLIAPVDYHLIDGNNDYNKNQLLYHRFRAWEHDYYTASLPFAQKGQAVDIPLGNIGSDVAVKISRPGTDSQNLVGTSYNVPLNAEVSGNISYNNLYAETDGLEIEPTTINDLRRAFRLQEWLEKNARGGTRYIENILTHFGVKSSDARLQRPEYITGVKSPVIISEVLNTTGSFKAEDPTVPTSSPQGNMAGHGVGVTSGNYASYFCEEHGYIIGVMSVMPKTAYQQGIPRTYLKREPLDFYWPSFANIGEQEVQYNEIFGYESNGEDTFGYVPRYAEYKYLPSRVAGDFRTTLNYWHLGRIFENQPTLSQQFIECDPEQTKRIFAVENGVDTLYCHVLNKVKAVRPMPKFGTPML